MDPQDQQEEDPINRLERSLYAKDPSLTPSFGRHTLDRRGFSVRRGWRHDARPEEVRAAAVEQHDKKSFSASRWVLFGSLSFFLLSAGVAAYFFFGGANIVSARKIVIETAGPVTTDAGQEVPLQIIVRNENTTTLSRADLVVHFPEGSRSAANPTQEVIRHRESLGDMTPGAKEERIVRAILFGEQGEIKNITISLEYRVPGSNAVFVKEQEYELVIGSSSVRVSIDSFEEVNARQEMEFTIQIASNSDTVLQNVLLIGEYPLGFAYTSAAPAPTFGTNVWRIGTLNPEEQRTIKVRGVVDGQDGEDRVFRFTAGIQNGGDETRITTPLLSALRTVTIKKPFLGVRLLVSGTDAAEHAASSGRSVNVQIEWANNLPSRIIDTQIEAVLSGNAFDRASVRTTDGSYRSSDHTIIWNERSKSELLSLEPGVRGNVSFSFSVPDFTRGLNEGIREPFVDITVNVRGRRTSEDAVPEEIRSTAVTRVNVRPDIRLSSRGMYFAGPFQNTGPMPPKADTETTYTITWSVTNTTSDVRDVEVSATLPPNVRWVGPISPGGEPVTFLRVGSTIVWRAGSVPAGSGTTRSPREVSFQVAATPSITDVGNIIDLLRPASLTGVDAFTGDSVTANAGNVTTRLTTDPGFQHNDAFVVP